MRARAAIPPLPRGPRHQGASWLPSDSLPVAASRQEILHRILLPLLPPLQLPLLLPLLLLQLLHLSHLPHLQLLLRTPTTTCERGCQSPSEPTSWW